MVKKIKEFFEKRKQEKEKKEELLKMKDYYQKLQNGAMFVQYIYKDLERAKKTINRAKRRRMENELKHNGKFSEETIRRYMTQINEINKHIENELKKLEK